MPQPTMDIVTVVYRPEILLLALQARSMEKFLNPDNISRIHIIINDEDVAETADMIDRLVLSAYGRFRQKVNIVDGAALYTKTVSANGWRRQQSMKILISQLIESRHYLILDAKNHFLRPASVANFIAEDSRMWSIRTKINAPVDGFFWKSMRFLRLAPEIYCEKAMPTVTPYVVNTQIMREIIDYVEKKCGASFEEGFHAPGMDVTEFYLYFGYIIKYFSPLESIYAFGSPLCAALFTRSPSTPEGFVKVMKRLRSPSIIMLGLHRNRVGALSVEQSAMIVRQWVASGLFNELASADAFMQNLTESTKIGCIQSIDPDGVG